MYVYYVIFFSLIDDEGIEMRVADKVCICLIGFNKLITVPKHEHQSERRTNLWREFDYCSLKQYKINFF